MGSRQALRASAVAWFIPTLLGQWFFAYHIATAFIGPAFAGDLEAWNKRLFAGVIPGDTVGNYALGAHLFLAFVMNLTGALQLVPAIRRTAPAFHRWNGRAFIALAIVTSLAGIYMIWTRETFGGILINDISVSLNGLLAIAFAAKAWQHARARRFDLHERWALRTFIVASGVWFVRIIYAFLDQVATGPIPGIADDMTGPTNIAIGFASYLLPLAVLELYLWARASPSAVHRFTASAVVFAAALATAIGVYGRAARWLA